MEIIPDTKTNPVANPMLEKSYRRDWMIISVPLIISGILLFTIAVLILLGID